jgi:hypothetical protein
MSEEEMFFWGSILVYFGLFLESILASLGGSCFYLREVEKL